jgi:hypothetical protein
MRWETFDILPLEFDGSGVGLEVARYHVYERSLACTVGPHKAERFTRLNVKAQVNDGSQSAEILAQPVD